jgi:hypothetical protein
MGGTATGRVGHAVGTFCALWTGARFLNSFFHHGGEYRALHREARILLNGPCVTDAHSISGALIDCQNARRIVDGRTFGVLYATQHAAHDVLVETVRGASHELGFLVQLCLLLAACLFGMYLLVSRYAHAAQRSAWDKKAASGNGYGNCGGAYYQNTRAPFKLMHAIPSDDEADDDSDDDASPRRGHAYSRKMFIKLD